MKSSALAPLAALKGACAPVLKAKWRELFETEPPAYNRRFLESRLGFRLQEFAYGGLSRHKLGAAPGDGQAVCDPRRGRTQVAPGSSTDLGYQTDPGMAGCGALRDGARRGLR